MVMSDEDRATHQNMMRSDHPRCATTHTAAAAHRRRPPPALRSRVQRQAETVRRAYLGDCETALARAGRIPAEIYLLLDEVRAACANGRASG